MTRFNEAVEDAESAAEGDVSDEVMADLQEIVDLAAGQISVVETANLHGMKSVLKKQALEMREKFDEIQALHDQKIETLQKEIAALTSLLPDDLKAKVAEMESNA